MEKLKHTKIDIEKSKYNKDKYRNTKILSRQIKKIQRLGLRSVIQMI